MRLCKRCGITIGVGCVSDWCRDCQDDIAMIKAVKDDRKELDKLREIAKRAGAWQDKNGEWVYGNDAVVCDSHTPPIRYPASDIKGDLRKYYYAASSRD